MNQVSRQGHCSKSRPSWRSRHESRHTGKSTHPGNNRKGHPESSKGTSGNKRERKVKEKADNKGKKPASAGNAASTDLISDLSADLLDTPSVLTPSAFPELNQKFKTILCQTNQGGACTRGANCHFAHSLEEQRKEDEPLPQEYLKQVLQQQINFRTQPYCNYKTVKCRNKYEKGYCRFGTNCKYAHSEEELRNPHDPLISTDGNNPMAALAYFEACLSQPPPDVTKVILEKLRIEKMLRQSEPPDWPNRLSASTSANTSASISPLKMGSSIQMLPSKAKVELGLNAKDDAQIQQIQSSISQAAKLFEQDQTVQALIIIEKMLSCNQIVFTLADKQN